MGRQDALLILAVVVFAGLVVLLVGRGLRDPADAWGAAGEPTAVGPAAEAATGAGQPAESGPGPASAADPAQGPAGAQRRSETRTNTLVDRNTAPPDPGPDPAPRAGTAPGGTEAALPGADREGADGADAGDGLSIAGRVLDDQGAPVGGILITARRVGPNEGGRASDPDHSAQSGPDGGYALGNLSEGEYQLRTGETARHPPRTVLSRAGADAVDIILSRRQSLRIRGTVTDADDRPLAGVSVRPVGHGQGQTGEDGRYDLSLDSSGLSSLLLVRFSADGYRTEETRLELTGSGELSFVVDAKLQTEVATFRLEGRVRSSRGEPIAGETVQLRSMRLHASHLSNTGTDGRFAIDGFVASNDWRIHVQPRGEFADYRTGPLPLDRRSDPLDIILESLEGGRVTGRVVDPDGRPLPGFRLWLTSQRARGQSLQVVADADARFSVDGVPEGPLQFATRSVPWLRVSGAVLGERERLDVELVLDWGEYTLAGVVLGAGGTPLAGADVRLNWSDRRGGLHSTSFRRTVSDARGSFRFAQVARGQHVLEVRADGHEIVRRAHDVSAAEREVEIRLQSRAGK